MYRIRTACYRMLARLPNVEGLEQPKPGRQLTVLLTEHCWQPLAA